MTRRVTFLRRLAGNDDGVTVVEFAVIAAPLLMLLMGGLDIAHQAWVRAQMQGALTDAARIAVVENPDFGGGNSLTIERDIVRYMEDTIGQVAPNVEVTVDQRSYSDFSSISQGEKLTRDNNGNGRYDRSDEDCFEDFNLNARYDQSSGRDGRGGADEVVFYDAEVTMPRLIQIGGLFGQSNITQMHLSTAVRTQPYATRPNPPVLCGV